MASRDDQISITSEFRQWLRSKNVSSRQLRRDPNALQSYHKEWLRSSKPPVAKRKKLFGLPDMDLNQLGNGLNRANEIVNTFQSLRQMMSKEEK